MCIYGDPAYPLRIHLQAPFRNRVLTPQMLAYNSSMSAVRTALETMGKTHKRNSGKGSTCARAKRSRKNGTGALEYLKERAQQDQALKQEELELKKQENERLQNIQTQQI